MKCPSCNAELKDGSKFCEYCGSQITPEMRKAQEQVNKDGCPRCGSSNITFNREKLAEVREKSKTIVKRSTVGVCKDCGYTWHAEESAAGKSQGKRHTLLWVLGWIFCFPIPATILIWRKQNTWDKKIKIAATVAVWLLLIIFSSRGGSNSSSTVDSSSSKEPSAAVSAEKEKDKTSAAKKEKEEPVVEEPSETKEEPEGSEEKPTTSEQAVAESNIAQEESSSPKAEDEKEVEEETIDWTKCHNDDDHLAMYITVFQAGVNKYISGAKWPWGADSYVFVDYDDTEPGTIVGTISSLEIKNVVEKQTAIVIFTISEDGEYYTVHSVSVGGKIYQDDGKLQHLIDLLNP